MRKFEIPFEDNAKKVWNKDVIIKGNKTVKNLAKKLESIKISYLEGILNEKHSGIQNFMEYLKDNLYRIIMKLEEKARINKIIQKANFTEADKKELFSIVSKLPEEEFIQETRMPTISNSEKTSSLCGASSIASVKSSPA